MSNHNVNARELIEAIQAIQNKGWNWENPILINYAKKHPTEFIKSVEDHTNVNICNEMVHVIMSNHGPRKIPAIKLVRTMTNLGLVDAKNAVEAGNFKMYGVNNPEKMTKNQAKRLIDDMKNEWLNMIGTNEEDFPTFVIVKAK